MPVGQAPLVLCPRTLLAGARVKKGVATQGPAWRGSRREEGRLAGLGKCTAPAEVWGSISRQCLPGFY